MLKFKLRKLLGGMIMAAGLATLALAAAPAMAADDAGLRTFNATYTVTYRGVGAGELHVALRREPGTDRYIYETRAEPSLLARLVVSRNAVERSIMQIDVDGVRPLEWRLDDGRSGREDDGELRFDWENGRVEGQVGGQAVSLPTEPGLQDRMSIQIAVLTALMRGEAPGTIPLVDDEQIKRYSYQGGTNEIIKTQLGNLRTVVYESTRPGSSRVSKVWHAREHGFIPARAEQIRKGRVETVMVLKALEYTGRELERLRAP